MTFSLDSDRFANIKRQGGDAAAVRMLIAAKNKGAEPKAIYKIAKEIELSHTSLGQLRAVLGVQSEPKDDKPKIDRRKKSRPLDRYRERRAMEKLFKGASAVAYPVADDHVEAVLRLFGAYFDASYELDTDERSLFIVKDGDDERMWLCTTERHREVAERVTPNLSVQEIPTRVDAETFADVFPNAAPIDEIEGEGFVRLIVRGAKGF